jgi:hypothetical protein
MAEHRTLPDSESKRRVAEAARMFERVLVAWASDVLELRRRKLLLPRWHQANPALSVRSELPSQDKPPVVPMNDAA